MNKYTPDYSTKFRRNRLMLIKRGYELLLVCELMQPEYRDHPLKGNYIDYRECHVDGEGDWLLIYKTNHLNIATH